MKKELFENAMKFSTIGEMNPIDFSDKLKSHLIDINNANDLKRNEAAEKLIIETCHKYYSKNTIVEIFNAFDLYFLGEFDDRLQGRIKKLYSITLDFFIKIMNIYNDEKRKCLGIEKKEFVREISAHERFKIRAEYIVSLIEHFDYGIGQYVYSRYVYDDFIRWGIIPESDREKLNSTSEAELKGYAKMFGGNKNFSSKYGTRIKLHWEPKKKEGIKLGQIIADKENLIIRHNNKNKQWTIKQAA